jgi:hypothetical protein
VNVDTRTRFRNRTGVTLIALVLALYTGIATNGCHQGEPTARIAAVKILLHDVLDDRPEIAVCLLETFLVFRDEALEMMEKHPVEDGPLRMSRAIDSRHGGRKASRNGPSSRM